MSNPRDRRDLPGGVGQGALALGYSPGEMEEYVRRYAVPLGPPVGEGR